MRAPDGVTFQNITTDQTFSLIGGKYMVSVVATFGGGIVHFKRLGPDGSTYLPLYQAFTKATSPALDLEIGDFSIAGTKVFDLPPGTYKIHLVTATAAYVDVVRIPGD